MKKRHAKVKMPKVSERKKAQMEAFSRKVSELAARSLHLDTILQDPVSTGWPKNPGNPKDYLNSLPEDVLVHFLDICSGAKIGKHEK